MNLDMLFKFPGILILIGIVLLLIAIIIGVIAYKKTGDDNEDGEDESNLSVDNVIDQIDNPDLDINKNLTNNEVIANKEENRIISEPVTNDIPKVVMPDIKEVKEDKKVVEPIKEEQKEEYDNVVQEKIVPDKPIIGVSHEKEVNEDVLKKDDFVIDGDNKGTNFFEENNDMIKQFDDALEDEYVELDPFDDGKDDIIEPFNEKNDINPHQKIYGGVNPLDNVELKFDEEEEKLPYGEEDLEKTLIKTKLLFPEDKVDILEEDSKEDVKVDIVKPNEDEIEVL